MGQLEIRTESNQFNIPSIYLTFSPYRSLSIYNGDTLPPTAQSIWSLVNRFCHIWLIEWLSCKAQLVHCNIHKCTCTSKWRNCKIIFKIWFVNETVMGSESINKGRKKNLWLHQNGKKKSSKSLKQIMDHYCGWSFLSFVHKTGVTCHWQYNYIYLNQMTNHLGNHNAL